MAPIITSVIGTITDGSVINIGGSGFGTHGLDIEWLGGSTGNIESGTVNTNFVKAGWTTDSTTSERQTPQYSNTKAHSGTQSIKSFWPTVDVYTSAFGYDTGGTIGTLYMSAWIYFDLVDAYGQWKLGWIRPTYAYGGIDGSFIFQQWYTADNTDSPYNIVECVWNDYAQCYWDGVAHFGGSAGDPAIPHGKWVRLEWYGKESSGDNILDGELSYICHPQSAVPYQILVEGPYAGSNLIKTRVHVGEARWRWIVLENYWGQNTGGDGTNEKAYWDDIYIQVGTQARVEICDNAIWANRKHCEIQYPTAWTSDGLSITVTLNRGSFGTTDTAYLYVVDSTGTVSPAKEITFGGGIPSPPTNLRVD